MDLGGIRRLYLPLRPKARFSPGRKTPPGVSAPSTGLRPLNVSRVKCGADLVEATQRFHVREIRYAFNVRFKRIAEDLISACRKHVVAATGPSPFKVGDNQRPERTGEVGGINCGGDMGVRRCLARSLTSLAFRCALQRVQTVPAAIHSGRIPPSRHPPTGDGRLSQPPHHTGHGPFRTRPPTSVKSPYALVTKTYLNSNAVVIITN